MTDTFLTRSQLLNALDTAKQQISKLEAELTSSLQAQATLQEDVQRYQGLFEHSGDSILLVEMLTERIVEANTNAARRLGYEMSELLQLTLDNIETDINAGAKCTWQSTYTGTFVYQCHYRHKNGSLIPVEVSSRIIEMGGRDYKQQIVRDNSLRKEVEAEREQLIAELSAFAHTVAHDLKSPLAIAVGYAELLVDEYTHLTEEKASAGLSAIARMNRKMITVVDELLLLASTRDMAEIPLEPLKMERIVAEALTRLTPLIEQHKAAIVLPENGWPAAWGYAPWIEEVWVNYLSNAVKYGGLPPVLKLGADVTPEGMVRFWVSDNGAGLPPQKLLLLFTKFQRLGQVHLDGHGLGLSIVQRIITRLGGETGAESREGEGSTFYFTLPGQRP